MSANSVISVPLQILILLPPSKFPKDVVILTCGGFGFTSIDKVKVAASGLSGSVKSVELRKILKRISVGPSPES